VSDVLEWLRQQFPRIIAGAALAAVASVAGVVSYTHIDALTLALGGSAMAGHLMPFGVDGQMVVGSVVLMTATGAAARWGWLGIGLGMLESLFANYEAGISHGYLAAGWYAVPALSFAVATFTLERWAKAQVATSGQGGQGGQTNTEASDEDDSEMDTNPCSHHIASTAEESAIQMWLHARDCQGEPISQRQLSAAFGLSRPRVAELVAPHLQPVASVNGTALREDG
jgi:hypothetical protein